MKTIQLLFSLLILFLISACGKGENNGIPSYIAIDSVVLNTDASTQGSNHHAITDLWIETEGHEVGVFEYPNVIPVLAEGERYIILNAGVYVRGDYNNREVYPAYQPYKENITFIEKDTVFISPEYSYYDEVDFPLIEDFENGNIFSATSRTEIGDSINTEGRALHLHLDATTSEINTETSSPIVIPLGRSVYIEMEFRGDNDFGIGIEGLYGGETTSSYFFETFTPINTDGWFKIYYDITTIVNSLDATSFNFYLQAIKYDSVIESDIYIDNFKIVVI